MLTVALSEWVKWNLVLDDVIDALGVSYEYAAYNSTISGVAVCYLLLKK